MEKQLEILINQCDKEIANSIEFNSTAREQYWRGKRSAYIYVRDHILTPNKAE